MSRVGDGEGDVPLTHEEAPGITLHLVAGAARSLLLQGAQRPMSSPSS
jgi:hypothetical protein